MQCPKCGNYLTFLQRIALPHRCKAIPKFGPAFTGSRIELWGRGQDWMKEEYGEYYAKYPAVYAAVKLRADSVLAAPLRVYRRLEDGDREEVEADHPLSLLLSKVNAWWTGGDLLRATSIYLDLWGSAFWVLKKAGPTSIPTEIWIPRPDKMRIVPSQANYIDGFWYQASIGTKIPLRTDEVIWFRQLNPLDEYAGLSPIAPARLSIDMGHEGIQYNRNIFKNGMLWGNVALTAKDATFTEEQAKEFRDALRERYSKPANAHVPLIMGNFDVKNLGLSNRDLEFIAALRWSLEDVARVYSVPKPMLGDLERATYENIDAAERIFWRSAMVPHLRFIQDELTELLAPMFGEDLEIAFDTTAVEALQEDANAVAERNIKEVQAGLKTINEVRETQGLDPVPWGDVAWMPMGIQPITSPEDAQPPLSPFGAPTPDEEQQPERTLRQRQLLDGRWKKFTEAHFSDTFIGKILALHERALVRSEGDFRRMQSGLFREQKQEVMRRVVAQRNADGTVWRDLPGLQLFNLPDWIRRSMAIGMPLYVAAATLGATQQSAAFSLGVAFDRRNIQPWLDSRVGFWAQRVNEETGRLLMQELGEGLATGESLRKLQDRIERVFDFSEAVRSERIARTETQAAMNEGAVEAYRQSGVVERKMWLATLDDRTRDTHFDAHRQVVELEADFLVGGEMIGHPGDGSPENAVNCRCTIAPVLSRRVVSVPLNGNRPIA